ncbi:GNAT family N-acetyltransferase [Georgenia sp. AZ-5]|uniref:GNAT family N-acetyltransferase n=1 Tax=Georgenia sp. AZ-5 TaxID=3367526 RepID=UPI003754649A
MPSAVDRPAGPLAERLHVPDVAELPPPHLGLTWRALTPADDEAVRALADRCAPVDRPVRRQLPGQQVAALATFGDVVAHSLGGFDGAGELRAMALVYLTPGAERVLTAYLSASIDPGWRGRGIGRALLDWQDARARQLLAADGRDLPVRIAAYVDEHLADRRKLYVAAGFSPKRVVQRMSRPVAGPLPEARPPAGVRIVDWSSELDEAVRGAHNEVFAVRWGAEPIGPGRWALDRRDLVPSWSKVALTEDGEVAGYALTCRHEETPAAGEGCTEKIGVRGPYRRQGVASALLCAVVRALAADGTEVATLEVDAVEGSGDHRFCERLGYERRGARILYTIET